MTLSDTQRLILTQAAEHSAGLAAPPASLPPAPRTAVAKALLKTGLLTRQETSDDTQAGLAWKLDGEMVLLAITDAGRLVLAPAAAEAPATAAEGAPVSQLGPVARADTPPSALAAADGQNYAFRTAASRQGLRQAAAAVLAACDAGTDRGTLEPPMAALRALLARPAAAARSTAPRQPRQGTKQQAVLALLRRPEGATVAQVAEATGWAHHTVRGFFAGLKKRRIEVSVLERVRQVGPNKQGAKGSYSIYRVGEAG